MNRRNFLIMSVSLAAGLFYWPHRWTYIVIHHSAGAYGNIELMQRVHEQRQPGDPINAMAYHFIIGNGNGMKMGEVASDWRWHYRLWGAHVRETNFDRNFRGLGICLVGNFDKSPVPEPQYKVLLHLTKRLMNTYDISARNVTGHGMTPGEHTRCPGKNFPMNRFKSDISTSG